MQMTPFLQVLNAERGVTMRTAAVSPFFEAKCAYSRLTWHYTTRSAAKRWKCRTTITVVKEPFETDAPSAVK